MNDVHRRQKGKEEMGWKMTAAFRAHFIIAVRKFSFPELETEFSKKKKFKCVQISHSLYNNPVEAVTELNLTQLFKYIGLGHLLLSPIATAKPIILFVYILFKVKYVNQRMWIIWCPLSILSFISHKFSLAG